MALNIYILVTMVVLVVLLIIVNIYLFAYYCHPDDSGIGAGLFCKFLVVTLHPHHRPH